MDIYTAQYKYSGDDRVDITVKGDQYPGNILAPTWEMVRGLQKQKLTQWDYTTQYFSLLIHRSWVMSAMFQSAMRDLTTPREQMTLVCFCPSGEFCHRILAARMLENMGVGKYIGERQI